MRIPVTEITVRDQYGRALYKVGVIGVHHSYYIHLPQARIYSCFAVGSVEIREKPEHELSPHLGDKGERL